MEDRPGEPPAQGRAPAEATAGSGAGAAGSSGRIDRVLRVLARVLPVLRGVRSAVTVLAVLAAGAVVATWVAWATARTPSEPLEWLVLSVLCGILLIPSILLVGARWMLGGILELPQRLKAEPGLRRDQLQDLVAVAQGTDPAGTRPPSAPPTPGTTPLAEQPASGGPVRRAWGAGRILLGARTDLLAYTALLRVFSFTYLASAFVSAAVACLEVLVLYPVALVIVVIG